MRHADECRDVIMRDICRAMLITRLRGYAPLCYAMIYMLLRSLQRDAAI